MSIFEIEIVHLFQKQGLKDHAIEIPPDSSFGDYAVACFFYAKEQKKAPNKVAEELAKKLKSDLFEKIEAKGAYVNFFVKQEVLAKNTLNEIKKGYGASDEGKGQKVMVEFASPNTNKPLHLGHVRNILIGETLSRMYEKTGHKVIRACLVNDRGIHISKSMLAYHLFGGGKDPDKKTDHFVGDWYVRYNQEAAKNPDLEGQARQMLLEFEGGKKDLIKLWKKMNKWVYKGFDETYKKLKIKFDKTYYESDFFHKAKDIVVEGLQKGVFKMDDKGNIIALLSKHGFNDDKVILRADGTSVYITQDIYLAKKKFDDYEMDKSLYVVASEQNLHFKQLFKILELLEFANTDQLNHVNYGMVYLPEGKMKSREGTVVDADNLITEVKDLASQEIRKRHKGISENELEKRKEIIGMGALRFFILKMDAQKSMVYNPGESVSFEGETGPYVQYAHARINSIFEKGRVKAPKTVDYNVYDDKEKQIIKKLALYPQTVFDSTKDFKPSLIARYLLDLAQLFNEYYHTHPILKAEPKVKDARLKLIDAIRFVIKDGLQLFGIESPEEM